MLFSGGKVIAGDAGMAADSLGKVYTDGQVIVQQGAVGPQTKPIYGTSWNKIFKRKNN